MEKFYYVLFVLMIIFSCSSKQPSFDRIKNDLENVEYQDKTVASRIFNNNIENLNFIGVNKQGNTYKALVSFNIEHWHRYIKDDYRIYSKKYIKAEMIYEKYGESLQYKGLNKIEENILINRRMIKDDEVNTKDEDTADINTRLINASNPPDDEKVKELIEKGADINTREENGYTPVMLALGMGHWDLVEYLVKKGADLNLKNNNGENIIDIAKSSGVSELGINFLKKNGAKEQ